MSAGLAAFLAFSSRESFDSANAPSEALQAYRPRKVVRRVLTYEQPG